MFALLSYHFSCTIDIIYIKYITVIILGKLGKNYDTDRNDSTVVLASPLHLFTMLKMRKIIISSKFNYKGIG